MIFELHKSDIGQPIIVFEDSDTCWECLEMLDRAFSQNMKYSREYIIVSFNQYENGIMWDN